MTVNILLCDEFEGLLPASIPSYVSMFVNLFDSVRQDMQYRVYQVHKGQLPISCPPNELYLITGSNSGVYEHKKWIRDLLEFIRWGHSLQIRLAGICFGHQAIAQALGGVVEPALDKGWGTGIRSSHILDPQIRPYFGGETMRLHYNHHDQVVELPQEARVFASSDFCPYEGFRIHSHILTFQGHPEYTDAYNQHLLLHHSQDEEEAVRKKGLESITNQEAMSKEAARCLLSLLD